MTSCGGNMRTVHTFGNGRWRKLKTSVFLRKGAHTRVEYGHPWVFAGEIERMEGTPEPGALVDVFRHSGKYVGTGTYSPHSQIRVRIVSRTPVDRLDKSFFVRRFEQCRRFRERWLPGAESYRAVYGEADFLPGLIVDKFANVLVVQVLSMGMEAHRGEIVEALVEVFRPDGIYERSDAGVRQLEGLELRSGPLYGECPRFVDIDENGLIIRVDVAEGQKTGYFLDQRENRAAIAKLMTGWGAKSGIRLQRMETGGGVREVPVNANGKIVTYPYWDGATVLECFAHTGSFTLHACQYGAKKVTCLDISEQAIEVAKYNVERNGFLDRVEFVVGDAFEYLRKHAAGLEERRLRAQAGVRKIDTSKPLPKEGRSWDVIILDPPAFAKSKSAVPGALRGYKDINLHALKCINDGGYLVTASCSSHVRPDMFLDTIREAAHDAGKILRLVDFRHAGKDHPHILGVDEGNYLKFAIFEVRSSQET